MASNYQAVAIDNFGGLDLRPDPEDGNPVHAINLNDVEFEQQGRVRQRAGTAKFLSQSSNTNIWQGLATFRRTGLNTPRIITMDQSNGQLRSYDPTNSGTAAVTFTPTAPSLPAQFYSATQIGIPTADSVMYLTGAGWDFMVKFDGTTFSNTAVSGGAKHGAVQYPDNRLVLANSDVATTINRVVFSGPNTPETFNLTDDYVDLLPGDGEQIIGMANYRNFLMVFKQSSFFQFYGNTTDSVGGTVFNYNTIKHNLNCPSTGNVVAAGTEGVYFLAKDGVYLTTGGWPQKISAPLDPLFRGADDLRIFTAVTGIGSDYATTQIFYAGGRLYLTVQDPAITTSSTGHTFVFDPQTNTWSYWKMYNSRGGYVQFITGVFAPGFNREIPYFLSYTKPSTTWRSVIGYQDPTSIYDVDHDVSVSLNGMYRTNYLDLGTPGSMKKLREVLIDGYMSGTTLGLGMNGGISGLATTDTVTTAAQGSPSAATWPNYNLGLGRSRKAARAQSFSFQVTGVTWALHRLTAHLSGERPAGPRIVT